MTEKKKNGSGGKTRREFLKDAGLLVGGTAIGSTVLLAACGGGEETTVTKTVTSTAPGGTTTVTAAATTVTESKFVCPIDQMEFDTLAELQAHFAAEHADTGAMPNIVTLSVNGSDYIVHVEPEWPLSFVIREKLGLTGLKVGCDRAECGSCMVLVDGKQMLSCTMLAIECQGMNITTIEGLADGPNYDPVQQLFLDNGTYQCGFCTPGMIMSAKSLLDKNSSPSRAEVKKAMSGNLCFCMDYTRIIDTVVKGV